MGSYLRKWPLFKVMGGQGYPWAGRGTRGQAAHSDQADHDFTKIIEDNARRNLKISLFLLNFLPFFFVSRRIFSVYEYDNILEHIREHRYNARRTHAI